MKEVILKIASPLKDKMKIIYVTIVFEGKE